MTNAHWLAAGYTLRRRRRTCYSRRKSNQEKKTRVESTYRESLTEWGKSFAPPMGLVSKLCFVLHFLILLNEEVARDNTVGKNVLIKQSRRKRFMPTIVKPTKCLHGHGWGGLFWGGGGGNLTPNPSPIFRWSGILNQPLSSFFCQSSSSIFYFYISRLYPVHFAVRKGADGFTPSPARA